MRRGRTFSSPSVASATGSEIALFAVRFAFSALCFSLPLSRAYGPLLILRSSSFILRARNLPRDHFRVDTDSTRIFPGDTVFLDIFPRSTMTATGKCGACFSSCQVLARDDRTLSPRIYVAKHDGRESSAMKFGNGTIPF